MNVDTDWTPFLDSALLTYITRGFWERRCDKQITMDCNIGPRLCDIFWMDHWTFQADKRLVDVSKIETAPNFSWLLTGYQLRRVSGGRKSKVHLYIGSCVWWWMVCVRFLWESWTRDINESVEPLVVKCAQVVGWPNAPMVLSDGY